MQEYLMSKQGQQQTQTILNGLMMTTMMLCQLQEIQFLLQEVVVFIFQVLSII